MEAERFSLRKWVSACQAATGDLKSAEKVVTMRDCAAITCQ